ncbi:MAG: hypothetical protein LBG06_13090 [Deltaproteobacteria bacterium]|jgi:hypothetical protein|nr:hypothetical protein [Deltaproteobacteria bacterium]
MLDFTTPIGGLNIKAGSLYGGSFVSRAQNRLQNSVLKIDVPRAEVQTGAGQAADEGRKGQLARNFAASLLANLVAADRVAEEKNRHGGEENEGLVRAVADFADEARELFGDAEANRFMANVLLSTDGAVTETRIAAAAIEFLGKIKGQALGTLAGAGASGESQEKALELLRKVGEAVTFLNDGPRGDGEGSVAAALNGYFGKERVSDEDRKQFTQELQWLSAAEQAGAEAATELVISRAELGDPALDAAVAYLTEELAAAEAAKILQDLKDEEDVLEAVDRVREKLASMDEAYEAARAEGATAAASAVVAAAAAASAGDAAEEREQGYTVSDSSAQAAVKGAVEASVKSSSKRDIFDEYLQKTMANELNRAIKEDERLSERLRNLASMKLGVDLLTSSTISVGGWPGLGFVHTAGVSVSVGWKREYSLSVNSDGKIEAGMSESVEFSATFSTGIAVGVGLGGLYGAYAASTTLDLARTLEHSYSQGRIGTNRTSTVASRSFLLSRHV